MESNLFPSRPTKATTSPLSADELPALLRAIDGCAGVGDKLTAIALRLLVLTFVRTGELIGATWHEIGRDNTVWIIPGARMKMKTDHGVPLSRRTVDLLREAKAIGGGSKGRTTGHGFRSVASTVLNESGKFRPDVIERQLAHWARNEIRGAHNRAEYLRRQGSR